MNAVEHAMHAISDRLESMIVDLLPTIADHISRVTEGLAQRQLDLEVDRRKWNLVIHSIKGVAKEEDEVMRGIITMTS